MKKLIQILPKEIDFDIVGNSDIEINNLELDSRKISAGDVFVAVVGSLTDGHGYIKTAVEKGAKAIVCQQLPENIEKGVTYIVCADSGLFLGKLAANYFDNPSEKIELVGVTGTNGKTTVATLLFNLFKTFGHSVGLLSTVENKINEQTIPATHTTPDAITLNRLLAEMVSQGCQYVFMEVSSHAIHQHRVGGLKFKLAAFTNITHDHLDYHENFANYRNVKKQLFDGLAADSIAITNKDDKNGLFMLQNCRAAKYSYSLHSASDFKARIIEHDFNGMLLEIDNKEAWYHLVGKFNAYNLLLVYSVAFLLGKSSEEIITTLTLLHAVSGRFEYIKTPQGIIGVVDYAHTPDALQNVLETINAIRSKNEQLITVVGCGGNRDHEKRPIMAKVACELGDKVILTSDNPRNENPEAILADMQTGVEPQHYKKTLKITDREEAIKTAISLAKAGDIILLAGKGHETYQEIKGVKYPFDDRQIFIKNATLMS
ncbi:MAG: UDP-N-acetylmuramoyl-L-alanyl-D-glutamate--2,6-diaminopimelate ligase [Flavobacteriales bacterium]|nr:UDP-N-acetylmuramoyl-L-alanyl-D-glutamate--2,6-diaminopimelate ligase [Flavobacteriales bacterium]